MKKINTTVEIEWVKEVTICKRNTSEHIKHHSVFIVTEEL